MDHKTWLWRKKSTEKTIVSVEKANFSLKGNEDEVLAKIIPGGANVNQKDEIPQADKVKLEKDLKILNDKLSSTLSECNAKDDLVKKNTKVAQEAIAGWEKAEKDAVSLKQELDKALQQRVAVEERLTHLDAALKECMQQLRFVREEQEQRIHDAVVKTSRVFEETQMALEEKLEDTSKRLAKLGVENTQLSKTVLAKEKLIEDLNERRLQAETDFNALMTKLNSMEKDNASLKYEVRVLEKELEIRNEEREFNRRTADASHKQHLESVKKIAKLESECQRLRLLVRKRLPGPAALAKMKNEVELLGKDPAEMRRRKLNSSPPGLTVDFAEESSPDTPSERISFLAVQLHAMEEENRNLKESLNKKANELQLSRIMHARSASKLSQVEVQLEESSNGLTIMEPMRQSLMSQELSLASMSDIGSDDKVSCAESWASALISELEHFKSGKQKGMPSCKTVGVSDINLMDDFVEMEKLAVVSVDKPFGSSRVSSNKDNASVSPLEVESGSNSGAVGREMVPVSDTESGHSFSNPEAQSKHKLIGNVPGWLQDLMKMVLEQYRVMEKSPDGILEDIRIALAYVGHSNPSESIDARESSNHPVMDSSDRDIGVDISLIDKTKQFQPNLNKSMSRIIELIEGISLPPQDYNTRDAKPGKDGSNFPYGTSETPTGYMVRVFQWKTSELSAVLQQFVHSCNDLLNGKSNLEKFTQDVTSALEWIVNHCFSLQDVSSMRDAIKKHFDWDESRSEFEVDIGMISHSETDKLHVSKEQSCLPAVATLNGYNLLKMDDLQFDVREESKKLKDELISMESAKMELEEKLHAAIDKSESLTFKLRESEKRIASLQTELQKLNESKEMIEDQIENHKLMNEDLDSQLTVARVELNEARQKFSKLEVELDSKNNFCEELEAMCLDLQLQLESVTKKEIDIDQEEKQLRTEWEITAASEKLAECQETILNLGKQLKALATPNDTTPFDKVISIPTEPVTATTPKEKCVSQRSSLLDQMLAEDESNACKETFSALNLPSSPALPDSHFKSTFGPSEVKQPLEMFHISNGANHYDDGATVGSLAIVPSKKRGGGLLRKLLWRRKKGNSKKMSIPFPA